MSFKEYLDNKKENIEEASNDIKEYKWLWSVKCDKKTKGQLEKEMQKLFDKYVPKTKDGYIENK